ncbi:MAG: hypothetical protein H0W33_00905 [Gammaproteobacteria bacterium]|nr:hypothetical protein [Gammaproteobacteria bacterium]
MNETLRAELTVKKALPGAKPYELRPRSLGSVRGDVDLDKTLSLADRLEDEEILRKLRLRNDR